MPKIPALSAPKKLSLNVQTTPNVDTRGEQQVAKALGNVGKVVESAFFELAERSLASERTEEVNKRSSEFSLGAVKIQQELAREFRDTNFKGYADELSARITTLKGEVSKGLSDDFRGALENSISSNETRIRVSGITTEQAVMTDASVNSHGKSIVSDSLANRLGGNELDALAKHNARVRLIKEDLNLDAKAVRTLINKSSASLALSQVNQKIESGDHKRAIALVQEDFLGAFSTNDGLAEKTLNRIKTDRKSKITFSNRMTAINEKKFKQAHAEAQSKIIVDIRERKLRGEDISNLVQSYINSDFFEPANRRIVVKEFVTDPEKEKSAGLEFTYKARLIGGGDPNTVLVDLNKDVAAGKITAEDATSVLSSIDSYRRRSDPESKLELKAANSQLKSIFRGTRLKKAQTIFNNEMVKTGNISKSLEKVLILNGKTSKSILNTIPNIPVKLLSNETSPTKAKALIKSRRDKGAYAGRDDLVVELLLKVEAYFDARDIEDKAKDTVPEDKNAK